jgi:peptidyl-prolyl cis-trans isomerase C
MHRQIRFVAFVMVALLAAAAMVAVAPGCAKDKSGAGDQEAGGALAQSGGSKNMVAKVNGKTITEAEVSKETQRLTAAMGGQADPQQMASAKGMVRRQAIEMMINRTLLEQAAKNEGIAVARDTVAARMTAMKSSFPSEQAFAERLAAMGITSQDFEKEIETGIQFETLLAKHTSDVKAPTMEEMKAYYDSNPEDFRQPEQIQASHILVQLAQTDTDAQKAEKRARAGKILADLKGGADFAQTASQFSDCPSKRDGGNLGYFRRGQMVPAFETAAFALKVGEMSGVVETNFGYHIIKLTDHKPARDVSFEEAQRDISGYLTDQAKQQAIGSYLQTLRGAAQIEYGDTAGTGQ